MKRRLVITAFLLVASIVAVAVLRRGQPSYQGRSLQSWMEGFQGSEPGDYVRSAEAVRHLGAEAVPFILRQITNNPAQEEPRFKQKIRGLLERHPFVPLPTPSLQLRSQAMAALDALGPEAQNAIPLLESILQSPPPDTGPLIVLARIGKPAIPSLERARTNQNEVIRTGARICIDLVRTNSPILSPPDPMDNRFSSRICALNSFILSQSARDWAATNKVSANQVTNPFAPNSFR